MGFLRAFRPIAMDLLATIIFVATLKLSGNIVLATAAGVAAGVARFAIQKLRGQPIGPLQYVSVLLVLAGGTATIMTNNVLFMQIKTSAVTAAVGVVMLSTNWMAPYLPSIVTENIEPSVIRWTSRAWGLLQIVMAAINIVVARVFGLDAWTAYTAFVPTAVLVAAFAVQYLAFRVLVRRNIVAKMQGAAQQAA